MTEQQIKEEQEKKRQRDLVGEIHRDFAARREMRRQLERGWELNMKFLSGDQFCDLMPSGEIEEDEKQFFWQSRRCFSQKCGPPSKCAPFRIAKRICRSRASPRTSCAP